MLKPGPSRGPAPRGLANPNHGLGPTMRSILLALFGVPIPIILLLAFCTHHF
jgi:hypothetical protein